MKEILFAFAILWLLFIYISLFVFLERFSDWKQSRKMMDDK